MKRILSIFLFLSLAACTDKKAELENTPKPDNDGPKISTDKATATSVTKSEKKENSLEDVLASQNDEAKARYNARHPRETLEFFGIKPGMRILEALPGGGWYSKILQPYLGKDGKLVGVDYDYEMWPNFAFVDDAFMEKRKTWAQEWPEKSKEWADGEGAPISAYTFATLPDDLQVDGVLFIRALHNLNRFEENGQYLTKALRETHRALKTGGFVGVVQHQAPEEKSDEWANGSKGYLKKSRVIEAFKSAGFELVKESDININLKDQPEEADIVWRLPPSLSTSKDNEEKKAEYVAIGESSRMTLLFQKPKQK